MNRPKKKKTILIAGICISILLIFSWAYGWFGGEINIMQIQPDEVSYIELNCTVMNFKAVAITNQEDILTIIDKVNSLQYSGNSIQFLLNGVGSGGTVLFEISTYLVDGDKITLCLSTNDIDNDEALESDELEMSYWFHEPMKSPLTTSVCRGSMSWFFELHDKYLAYD